MNKIITYENLRLFAYSNDLAVTGTPRGIVLNFFGLGDQSRFGDDTPDGKAFADDGLIYVIPYTNPWAWMNRQAVDYTDEIVSVLKERYGSALPVVSTGGSMGGLSALIYTKYSSHSPIACVANCPVCDLPYHYTERTDLPRTLYSAFGTEEGELTDVLKRYSPLHLAESMPHVRYRIFHCECDNDVNLHRHSEKFVHAMESAGHDITFETVPNRGHCDLTDEAREHYNRHIIDSFTLA